MSREKREIAAIDLCWFLLIAYLSSITAYHSDDYSFMHIFGTDILTRNLADMIHSSNIAYMNWGGRYIVFLLFHIFSRLPKAVFNVTNGLVYVVFIQVLFAFICKGLKMTRISKPLLLGGVFFAAWFMVPSMYENLWICGSIDYLWSDTIILLFAYQYFKAPKWTAGKKTSILSVIGMLFFGLMAGLSNESASCTLISALFVFAVWNIKKHQRIAAAQWAGVLGALIGFLALMLAPGNFARISVGLAGESGKAGILYQLIRTTYFGMRYNLLPMGIALFFVVQSKDGAEKWWARDEVILLFFALINIWVMAFSLGYAVRTVLFSTALCVIAVGRAVVRYYNLRVPEDGDKKAKRLSWRVLYVAMALLVLLEAATGALQHYTKGTNFDRKTVYYEFNDDLM